SWRDPGPRRGLEAPAGLIEVTARCRGGKAEAITLTNVPAFADRLQVPMELPSAGTIIVDTAFGGEIFVMADAKSLAFAVVADEARDLAIVGRKLVAAANEQLGF